MVTYKKNKKIIKNFYVKVNTYTSHNEYKNMLNVCYSMLFCMYSGKWM